MGYLMSDEEMRKVEMECDVGEQWVLCGAVNDDGQGRSDEGGRGCMRFVVVGFKKKTGRPFLEPGVGIGFRPCASCASPTCHFVESAAMHSPNCALHSVTKSIVVFTSINASKRRSV